LTRGGIAGITPFLWFDGNAEEAMNVYASIFKNSKIAPAAGGR
jgi:predicted 3-demethylubiquinone-9 3-methyltransferase (glyoxalase superfamily)